MPPPSPQRATLRSSALIALNAASVLSVLVFTTDHLYSLAAISGSSMAPTFSPSYHETGAKDYVLLRKHGLSSSSSSSAGASATGVESAQGIGRGEVVRFKNPLRPEGLAIKRVVAVEGDEVVLDARRRPWPKLSADEAEANADVKAWRAWPGGRARVPKGHVWVEGDNWRESKDSNYYGPISRGLIDGKTVGVVWPPSRVGWVGRRADGEGRTRVVEARGGEEGDWTEEGLPVALGEIAERGGGAVPGGD